MSKHQRKVVESVGNNIIEKAEHFAKSSGDLQFSHVIEGNAHSDVAQYLRDQGFAVTCLDETLQKYRIEWR